MNSYIDALKAKYNMSNADYVKLKDLIDGFKELGYRQGYIDGYTDGYKFCIKTYEPKEFFDKANDTLDKIENWLRGQFKGWQ